MEDSCGIQAYCVAVNHAIQCHCNDGFFGNPYIECTSIIGCRVDSECSPHEACINGKCGSPCNCGVNAICDVQNHVATCQCPPNYVGEPLVACTPPLNPCDPNPCGEGALCELDNGNPICYCPKGTTGNPFMRCSKYQFIIYVTIFTSLSI